MQNNQGEVPELRSIPEKKGWDSSSEFDSNEDMDNVDSYDAMGWNKRAAAAWMVNNPNKFQRHGPSPIDFRMTRSNSIPFEKYYRNSEMPMAEYRKRMVAPSAPFNFQWEKEYSPIATEYKKRGPNFSLDFMDSIPR